MFLKRHTFQLLVIPITNLVTNISLDCFVSIVTSTIREPSGWPIKVTATDVGVGRVRAKTRNTRRVQTPYLNLI